MADRENPADDVDGPDNPPTDPADGAADRDQPDKDPDDNPDLGDAGKRAIDAMKRERNAARKELLAAQAQLKEHADAQKTDTERLQETAQTSTARADRAEASLRAMQVAMDRAPDGATIAHVRAVAKRVRGDSDDDLQADADELFTLVVPKADPAPSPGRRVPGKPVERLRGGLDPEEDIEENDPSKLADLIGRH